ncbi:MAG TPA: hypothetical protein VJ851_08870 [Jatrophihabitans sp.]|nr:hypothetical protein [Jatrophihabitans sp.]
MTRTASPSSFAPERLSSGAAGSVLLVDFQPYSSGKRLGDFVAADATNVSVQQIEPARDLSGRTDYLSLDEIAAHYADAYRECADPDDTMVVGYCSAAVLAVRIAALLTNSRRVRVALLRPTWPDTAMISEILGDVRAEIGAAGEPPPELVAAPQAVLHGISDTLHRDLRALASLHGLDPTSRPLLELLERYQGWFGYLLAAREAVDGLTGRASQPPAEVLVLAESAEQAAVPGLAAGSYHRRLVQLPDGAADLVTGELARLLLAELG